MFVNLYWGLRDIGCEFCELCLWVIVWVYIGWICCVFMYMIRVFGYIVVCLCFICGCIGVCMYRLDMFVCMCELGVGMFLDLCLSVCR